jgi:hypothetical protein
MTDTELAKYNSIGLASGQTSSGIIQEVTDDVAALVRGYIKGCPRNNLASTDAAIPTVLHSPALDIIIVELMKRVGGTVTDVSDVRIAAYNTALQFMEKVADCRFGIPKPANETTTALAFPSQQMKLQQSFMMIAAAMVTKEKCASATQQV